MKKKLFLQKDLEARKIPKNSKKKKKKNRTKVRHPAKASESLS